MRKNIDRTIDTLIKSDVSLDIAISPIVAPCKIEQHLESLGFERGNIDFNGQEWDYRIPFTKDNKKLMLSGSRFYGNQVLSNCIE